MAIEIVEENQSLEGGGVPVTQRAVGVDASVANDKVLDLSKFGVEPEEEPVQKKKDDEKVEDAAKKLAEKPSEKPAEKKEDEVILDKPALDKDGKPITKADEVKEDQSPFPAPKTLRKVGEGAKARDYSEFTEEEAQELKQMSGSAFDFAVKKLRELKQLQAAKPADKAALAGNGEAKVPVTFYEHENAYLLHPAYREGRAKLSQIRGEHEHWVEQLNKIEAGEKWIDLETDEKGELIAVEKAFSPQAKRLVEGYRMNAARMLADGEQGLAVFKDRLMQSYQGLRGEITNVAKRLFPDYFTENTPAKSALTAAKEFLVKSGLGDNILADLVAMYHVRLQEYKKALQEPSEAEPAKAAIAAKNESLAGVRSSSVGGVSSSKDSDDVVLDLKKFG